MPADRVVDIPQVLLHGRTDRDFARGDAEGLHQLHRVEARAGRSAGAGHGHADDALAVESQAAEGLQEHEQRQRRVEAAGHAEHDVLRASVAQAAGEAGRLDREDFVAVLVAALGVGRHEGVLAEAASQLGRHAGRMAEFEVDHPGGERGGGAEEGAVAAAFGGEFVHVDLRDHQGEVEAEALRFAQHDAVLGD